jgi:hypothetical protein
VEVNKIQLRQFGDAMFLAGELSKIFTDIKTYDEDKYKSLHLHNDLWNKIKGMITDDVEFRHRVAKLIFELGVRNAPKEEKTRRTVTGKDFGKTGS